MAPAFEEPKSHQLKQAPYRRGLLDKEVLPLSFGLTPKGRDDRWNIFFRERGISSAVLDVYRLPAGKFFVRIELEIIGEESKAGPIWYDPSSMLPPPSAMIVNQILDLVIKRNMPDS